jgi:hypothetical protein
VVPVCCGFGLAAGVLGQRVFGRSRRVAVAMVAVLVVWVSVREGICMGILAQQRTAFLALRDEVAAAGVSPGEPILVADSSFVLPLAFYSSEEVRRRIVFPIDFGAIHRVEPDDSGEENLWSGRNGVFPVRIMPFEQVPTDGPLLMVGRPAGWLAQALKARGVKLHEVGDGAAWQQVGGVFTPMAHPASRLWDIGVPGSL